MKDGKCPGCGSDKVYAANDLPLKGGPFGSNSIPISLTSMAPLDNYVCTACGRVESYIGDENKRDEIARKWTRVGEEKETDRPDDQSTKH